MENIITNNLPEFISIEEQNLLKNLANLANDFGFFQELDEIYLDIKDEKAKLDNPASDLVLYLFLQSHNEFYIGITNLLRLHLGKAFNAQRMAIEAAFNAYYLFDNLDNGKFFLDRESAIYKKVFYNVKQYIKKNVDNYPLSRELVSFHEVISRFGPHSTFESLSLKIVSDSIKKYGELQFKYFDYPKGNNEFKQYFCFFLRASLKIFIIFYEGFFKSKLEKEFIVKFDERIKRYEINLEQFSSHVKDLVNKE